MAACGLTPKPKVYTSLFRQNRKTTGEVLIHPISKRLSLTLSFVMYLSHSEISIIYPSKQMAFIRGRNASDTIEIVEDLASVILLAGKFGKKDRVYLCTDVVNLTRYRVC